MNPSDMKILIGFNIYSFSFRGTEVAIYDYADKNETILGNKSIILVKKRSYLSKEEKNVKII
jgi:hypothetical protein